MRELCQAPTAELCAEHRCLECKEIMHIQCAVFDEKTDKWICKNCCPTLSSPKAPTTSTTQKDMLEGATMESIELSNKAENVVLGNLKSQLTRLKSIKGNNISTIDLPSLCLLQPELD